MQGEALSPQQLFMDKVKKIYKIGQREDSKEQNQGARKPKIPRQPLIVDGQVVKRKRGRPRKLRENGQIAPNVPQIKKKEQRQSSIEPVELKQSQRDATDSMQSNLGPTLGVSRRMEEKFIREEERKAEKEAEREVKQLNRGWEREEVGLNQVLRRGLHYGGTEVVEKMGRLKLRIPFGAGRVAEMEWDEVARASPSWLLGFVEGCWV